ncbi:peptidylprolyl isomerase [bacterium]|nr:peptidylprolyl isomerase [bacterium]MBU1073074.1 peptidylprolyl isomerase [bacterium]MBU1674276.1 peptidylprolyl isomerase [bacterium]
MLASILLTAGVASAADTYVRLSTDAGEILLEMSPELAPRHVENYIHLCRSGFYDGTAFHRVIPGFMIQSGDPNTKDEDRGNDGQGGPDWVDVLSSEEMAMVAEVNDMLSNKGYVGFVDKPMIKAEFNAGHHRRGTLSMARSQSPDSGGSQFFICVAEALHLDGKYTVFGRVVLGLDTVDEIVSVERDRHDNPLQPLRIKRAEVLTGLDELTDSERAAVAETTAAPAVIE